MKLKICICGGGSLGHVLAGTMSSNGNEVNILTGRPGLWNREIQTVLPDGNKILGSLHTISSEAVEVIPQMDYVILCLPGYLISETLQKITPYLSENTVVGSVVSSNGFFWMAQSILPSSTKYFGFQRVPYIARVSEYGKSSELKGYKDLLHIAFSSPNGNEKVIKDLEYLFNTPIETLDTIWPAALTNSNPLLHTARLYSLFKNYQKGMYYEQPPLFYEEWDNESSELLLNLDDEFNTIVSFLPLMNSKIKSLKEHYESNNAQELTNKLRSIKAFKGIRLQMKSENDTFLPDFENRYFTEDIPFGLLIIKEFAEYFNVKTPSMDKVIYWAQKMMNKEYLVDGKLTGKDIEHSGLVKNYFSSYTNIL